ELVVVQLADAEDRQGGNLADGPVAPVPDEVETEADAAQERPLDQGHGRHPGGGAQAQQQLLARGDLTDLGHLLADDGVEGEPDGDHDQVVEDRGEHRHPEAAVGVEQAGHHRPDPVEHDLGHEHGQQLAADLDRLGPLGRAARVDVQPDDPGGGQHGDPGQQPQAGDGDGHGGPGHVPGLPLAAGAAELDEHGHEDGGQDPAQDQLVDDVGGGVGDVVDVG